MACDLICGILSCTLPEVTINVDLKVLTLWGIHTYKKDRSTQVIKCRPWVTKAQAFPSIHKKIVEFMRCRQINATPFANRSFQPRPKIAARNLVTITRPNRVKLSQPRKINIRPFPPATQLNWLATLKVKEAAGATTNLAPTQTSQPMDTQSTLSPTSPIPPVKFTEHTKYCAICTPLGRICLKEFPMSSDWRMMMKKEKTRIKEKTKNIVKGKHLKPAPEFLHLLPEQLSPPNPPSNSSARCAV